MLGKFFQDIEKIHLRFPRSFELRSSGFSGSLDLGFLDLQEMGRDRFGIFLTDLLGTSSRG
jgi:hypothetical protein